MTDIEMKALALVNEVRAERGYSDVQTYPADRKFPPFEALCRAIEQHEAFRQEVSDAVSAVVPLIETWVGNHDYVGQLTANPLRRFIIAKPDPLVEAVKDCQFASLDAIEDYVAKKLREALAKRGGKIVWEDEQ